MSCIFNSSRDTNQSRNKSFAPSRARATTENELGRDKNHGLYSSILPKKSYPDNYVSGVEWYVTICGGDGVEIGPDGTYTYEEAELECLNKLIEIVGTIELPQHPSVFSENGNELLFDEEGNLIKELPK